MQPLLFHIVSLCRAASLNSSVQRHLNLSPENNIITRLKDICLSRLSYSLRWIIIHWTRSFLESEGELEGKTETLQLGGEDSLELAITKHCFVCLIFVKCG